jgi:ankyrin repeat protein
MSPRLIQVLHKIEDADLVEFSGIALDSVNVRGRNFGETPLHVVAIWGDLESAKVLIAEGAVLDAQGENGYTPLHEAIEQGHIDIVRLLVEAGARMDLECSFGTPVQLAMIRGRKDLLDALAVL